MRMHSSTRVAHFSISEMKSWMGVDGAECCMYVVVWPSSIHACISEINMNPNRKLET